MIVRILVVVMFVLVVDGIWLRAMRPMYRKTIRQTQKKDMKLRMGGAVASYVCIIALIVFFAEGRFPVESKPRQSVTLALGFLYGAAIYGVFNGTNVAIFQDYSTKTAVIDTLWGGVLFASSIALYQHIPSSLP